MAAPIIPRDYQIEALRALWHYFENNTGNPLLALPTGSGKSILPALFIQEAWRLYPGTRIMLLTHVKTLISQNFEKLMAVMPTAPAGIYSAGLGRKEWHQPITFAGIASVQKIYKVFGPVDLVFVDEAHLVGTRESTMYIKFLDGLRQQNPHLKVIGMSATCYRTASGPLTDDGMFTDVCYDLTTPAGFRRLIDAGHLVRLVAKATTEQLDVSDVGTGSDGDYKAGELQQAVDHADVTERAVAEFINGANAQGCQRWLLFAAGVEHAEHVRDALERHGISAVCVHSKLKAQQNDENYEAFRTGRVQAAVSMNSLTTGIDVPEVDAIAMLRPTKSPGLWVQMLGRGTRPAPWVSKTCCYVWDFAGNTRRLGPIDDPVVPLPRRLRKKGIGPRMAPVRVCPVCTTYVHASLRTCTECGHEFVRTLNIKAHSEGLAVMQLSEPQVHNFDVATVTYAKHEKKGARGPSLRVSYFCGARRFTEYLCPEHGMHFTWNRWVLWWRERAPPNSAPPETVDAALERANELRWPRRVGVWINKPQPEITTYEW